MSEVNDEEEFSTTWAGGHALIIEFGDEEIYGSCQCLTARKPAPDFDEFMIKGFGIIRPDQGLDSIMRKWERHVMTLRRSS